MRESGDAGRLVDGFPARIRRCAAKGLSFIAGSGCKDRSGDPGPDGARSFAAVRRPTVLRGTQSPEFANLLLGRIERGKIKCQPFVHDFILV
jgi:hypothetical protein